MRKQTAYRIYGVLVAFFLLLGGVVSAGTEIGGFTAPLANSLGGTGLDTSTAANGKTLLGNGTGFTLATIAGTTDQVVVTTGAGTLTLSTPQSINTTSSPTFANVTDSGLTASSFVFSNATKVLASPAAPTNGQILIGSTGANPAVAALTAGTGISVVNGAGSITLSANGLGTLTVTAKTTNYTVVAGDSGTFFTNTAAGGEVDFTLPTAVVGQTFTFYNDTAAQTLKIIAGASTTIRLGSTVSAAAGNASSAVGQGGCVVLVAVSTTSWVARSYTGAWLVT